MRWRTRAFIAGTASGIIALFVTFLLRALGLAVFLPEFAADRFFSIVPGEIESVAVTTLREYAKLSAFVGFLLGTAIVYGLIGVVVHHSWNRFKIESENLRLLISLAVPLIIATLSFQVLAWAGRVPQAAKLNVLLVVGGFFVIHLIYGLFFSPILRWLGSARPPFSGSVLTQRLPRRRFLVSMVVLAIMALVGFRLTSFSGSRQYVQESGTVYAFSDIFDRPELSGMVSRETTPNEDFYVVSKNIIDPEVDERDWSLTITGLVERELLFRYEDLRSLPKSRQFATLICISNEVGGNLTSNAEWAGIPLGDLLDRAGPRNNANFVTFHCADGYTSAIPIDKAYEDGAMLALEMNGERLPAKHGFPLRAIIPNLYGMKNPKWIQRIELTEQEEDGYWESRGWSRTGEINTMSRIDVPLDSARMPSTSILAGIAFAGTRGIKTVEMSTDGEHTWQQTALKPKLSPLTWSLWATQWTAPRSGTYLISVRATTEDGRVQAYERTGPFPKGATGLHKITVNVKE